MIYRLIGNFEYILSTLVNGQLFFSKVCDFNDPFEWIFRYKVDLERDIEGIKKYVVDNTYNMTESERDLKLKNYLSDSSTFDNEINKVFEKFYNQGVCCFTEEQNILNVLMWAYYANSNKGVALGFDESNMEIEHADNLKNGEIIFRPLVKKVIYNSHKRYLSPFDKNRPDILDTKYMKSKKWEDEKEVRFVSPKFGQHNFNKSNLKEIVFGINTPENIKSAIVKITNEGSDYKNVKLKYCQFADDTLEMIIK